MSPSGVGIWREVKAMMYISSFNSDTGLRSVGNTEVKHEFSIVIPA
jgi:hypothetical protein